MRGRRPRGRPPAVRGLGRGGGSRAGAPRCPPSVLQCFPPLAAGGWLDGLGPGPPCGCWLRGVSRWRGGGGGDGGGGDSGGGCPVGGYPGPLARSPLPSPLRPPGVGPSCGPSPTTLPPFSSPPPRRVAPAGGEGGGPAGTGGGGPGQRLVVSGLRVSGAPVRASVVPAVSPTGGGACPLVVRTAAGWGGRSGSGGLGLPGGCPAPLVRSPPPRVRRLGSGARHAGRQTIVAGRVRHLRCRLRGGRGCGGGGFLGR